MPTKSDQPEGRTYALIVAVEEYSSAKVPSLNGPANDAVQVVNWLLQNGVPPENITALVSAQAGNKAPLKALEKHSGLNVVFKADQQTFYDTIASYQTNKLSGDYFVFYWSGHGLVTSDYDEKRLLLFSNYPFHLDLTAFSIYLRRTGLLASTFPKQIYFFTDACANIVEADKLEGVLQFKTNHFTAQRALTGLYSAGAGQYSKNDDQKAVGMFTDVMISQLKTADKFPPDMERLHHGVAAAFSELRQSGKTKQVPQYFAYRTFDGDEETKSYKNFSSLIRLKELVLRFFSSDSDESARETLLSNLKAHFIRSALFRSIYARARIEQTFAWRAAEFINPCTLEWECASNLRKELKDNTSIIQFFDDMSEGENIVLLGAAGSGKTTQLLELANYLHDKAKITRSDRLPVFLTLSNWERKHKTLERWVEAQLYNRFNVGRSNTRRWLKLNKMILLLDGLDEVAESNRESCVAAINHFVVRNPTCQIAISCRHNQYEESTLKLSAPNVLQLQPLKQSQIEQFFRTLRETDINPILSTTREHQGGYKSQDILSLIESDANLAELATTPLMLEIMLAALEGAEKPPEGLAQANVRDVVVSMYVERMLKRKSPARNATADLKQIVIQADKSKSWLHWLAATMTRKQVTQISADELQPADLTLLPRLFYHCVIIVILCNPLCLELATLLRAPHDQSTEAILPYFLSAAAFTVSAVWFTSRKIEFIDSFSITWWKCKLVIKRLAQYVGLAVCLIGAWLVLLQTTPVTRLIFPSEIITVISALLCIPLAILVPRYLIYLGIAFVVSTLAFCAIGMGLPSRLPLEIRLFHEVVAAFSISGLTLFYGILFEAIKLFRGPRLDPRKNVSALEESLNSSFYFAFFVGLYCWFVCWFLPSSCLPNSIPRGFCASGAYVAGAGLSLLLAWYPVFCHLVLRTTLYVFGLTPWRLGRFMEYACDKVLLQRQGRTYSFVHLVIQEYCERKLASPTRRSAS